MLDLNKFLKLKPIFLILIIKVLNLNKKVFNIKGQLKYEILFESLNSQEHIDIKIKIKIIIGSSNNIEDCKIS
jgi:hypothetical protein